MVQINQLSSVGNVSSGDQIPVYSPQNGDARRMSVSQLLGYFEDSFSSPTMAVTLYVPAAGFNLDAPAPTSNLWMLLQPAGTLLSGTINLPAPSATPDGTEILISTTQQITTFTLNGNGALAVNGAPTSLSAGSSLRVRYYKNTTSWYAITADSTRIASLVTSGNVDVGGSTSIGLNAAVAGTLAVGGATTLTSTLTCAGVTSSGNIVSNSTGKIGYTTGAGGAVTQATSKTTAVTLNKPTGAITMNNAVLNAGDTATFQLTNSAIEANDVVVINHVSGGANFGKYLINARCTGAATCLIDVTNTTAGNLSEALVLRFAVLKSVAS